jgi:hypothetical protein
MNKSLDKLRTNCLVDSICGMIDSIRGEFAPRTLL